MKNPKHVLLAAFALLAVLATSFAWQSYWKARWIEAVQVEDDTDAAQ